MDSYDVLIEDFQSGKINALEFLLSQEELSSLYIEDMLSQGITPDSENAEKWLRDYENAHLYQ